MDRILFLLSADSWDHAESCIKLATRDAAVADRVSWGLCLQEIPDAAAEEAMHRYSAVRFVAPCTDALSVIESLWQDERYVLHGSPALSFSKNWDIELIRSLQNCSGHTPESTVLTGWLPSPEDQLDAVCPVAAEHVGPEGRLHFRKGTPLNCAAAPQISAFLHPAFMFGPVAFFRHAAASSELPFVTAYAQQWSVMTLDRPILHFLWPQHVNHVVLPETEATERFCSWFGIDRGQRQLSAQARMGIFTADLRFPQIFPFKKRLRERWKRFINRSNPSTPLCVTYHREIDCSSPSLAEEMLRRFSWLAAMQDVRLVCYADSKTVSRLMPYTANVLDYRSRYGLPMAQIAEGFPKNEIPDENSPEAAVLGIPFLLSHTCEVYLNHSHFVWMNFDYLSFPMYPKTSLDWEILCGDRIMMAMVAGKPDYSMIVVPQELLAEVCGYVRTYCTVTLQQTGKLPDVQTMWAAMLRDQPDWVDCVDLPDIGQLFSLMLPSADVNE